MVTPDKTDNVFGAFIEVDLSGESDEYVGDSEGTVASVTVSIDGDDRRHGVPGRHGVQHSASG